MNSLSRFPFPVQWHEGMLLVPEHFQHTDRRIDNLFGLHLQTYIPYYWGVKQVEIDHNRLAAGFLNISILEAVLPDGTHALVTPGDDQLLEINLKDHENSFKEGSLMIHLAIPRYAAGYNNVSSEIPRFSSFESGPMADENTGEGQRRIPMLKPNLLLLPEHQVNARFESFPLFKITLNNNTFSLGTSYIPPHIRLYEGSELFHSITALCKLMREKILFLSNRLQGQRSEIMTDEAQQAMNILCMSVVPLESLMYSNVVHPFQLYVFLSQIAGYMAALDPQALPPFFKPYNHNELKATFEQVLNYIGSALNQLQEGYYILPFMLNERLFTLSLKPNYVSSRMIIGARASKSMSSADVTAWIQGAVIATENYVTSIRDKRVLGAVRHLVEEDEDMRLMAPREVVLFSVNYDPQCMDSDSTLCIFNVADSLEKRPEELVLYLPKEKNV